MLPLKEHIYKNYSRFLVAQNSYALTEIMNTINSKKNAREI